MFNKIIDFMKKNKKLAMVLSCTVLLLLLLTIILLVQSCNKKPKETTQNNTTTTTTTAAMETESEPQKEEIPEGYVQSDISGKYISPETDGKRPVAVVFNNTKVAVPQSGISQADVIYEAPMEGGDVRLLGIFQDYSNLEKIGSVRSARTYFIAFALEYDAILTHYGKAWTSEYLLNEKFVHNLDGTGGVGSTVFYRTSDRKAPHNAYASTDGILAGVEKMNYSLEHDTDYKKHFKFTAEDSQNVLDGGSDANYVKPGYAINKSWFEYNEEEGVYYRFQFEGAHIDEMNNEQLKAKNIIIQYTPCTIYEGSSYLNLNVWDGGSGYFITNGKSIPITWKKDSQYGATRYYDENGKEIQLNPGKTWISIMETSRKDKTVIAASKDGE